MLETLDKIVLSKNVVEDFYNEYKNNIKFRDWLDKLIPEIKKCEQQEQNNPWHKYNVLGHILHSVQNMNNMTNDLEYNEKRLLSYTMLFHDIGKPDCHIRRMKNGKMIDSFFNHNIKSEEIAKRVLPRLNFSENDSKIIEKLVLKHDIFMFIKLEKTDNPYWKQLTNEVILEEIEDLNLVGDGYKLMKYLIWVGRSDNLAQNEKMTAESLKMFDKFEMMLDVLEKQR